MRRKAQPMLSEEVVPLHRLAQIMSHNSLDTPMLYILGIKQDLQHNVEQISWT